MHKIRPWFVVLVLSHIKVVHNNLYYRVNVHLNNILPTLTYPKMSLLFIHIHPKKQELANLRSILVPQLFLVWSTLTSGYWTATRLHTLFCTLGILSLRHVTAFLSYVTPFTSRVMRMPREGAECSQAGRKVNGAHARCIVLKCLTKIIYAWFISPRVQVKGLVSYECSLASISCSLVYPALKKFRRVPEVLFAAFLISLKHMQ